MATLDELALLDATAQADLVRNKEVTALELVTAAIDRIERVNPSVNAVVIPMYEKAREAASRPLPEGPFRGVPFLLKDLAAEYAGVAFNEASAFLRGYVPTEDQELVRRYKRAGLIVIGKTNTPELGLGPTTEPCLYGATRNPWDPSRTAGGSSGGAGAAVASAMVPMAHGNDAGGSIRVPAACCGVFGLKPTRARNPLGPLYGEMMGGLIVEHALTRTVRDSARLLDATAGPDFGDPYEAPSLARPFAHEIGVEPGRLRVVFSTRTLLGEDVHPDCRAAVHDAARLLESLGHHVVEGTPPIDGEEFWRLFTSVLAAGFAWAVDDWSRRLNRRPVPEHFESFTWALVERGSRIQRSGLSVHDPGPAANFARGRALLRQPRRVAHAHIGRAPGSARHLRLHGARSLRAPASHGGLHAVHLRRQRHRPARHVGPAHLERSRPPHRYPVHRTFR